MQSVDRFWAIDLSDNSLVPGVNTITANNAYRGLGKFEGRIYAPDSDHGRVDVWDVDSTTFEDSAIDGDWIITITDNEVTGTGTLNSWSLNIPTNRFRVTKENDSEYDMMEIIPKTISSSYDMMEIIPKTISSSYDMMEIIPKTISSSYDMMEIIPKTISSSYDMMEIILKEITSRYDIKNKITREFESEYVIRLYETYNISGNWQGLAEEDGILYSINNSGDYVATLDLENETSTQLFTIDSLTVKGLAIHENEFYVVSTNDSALNHYDDSGNNQGLIFHGANKPKGIAIDGTGNIYVSDKSSDVSNSKIFIAPDSVGDEHSVTVGLELSGLTEKGGILYGVTPTGQIMAYNHIWNWFIH